MNRNRRVLVGLVGLSLIMLAAVLACNSTGPGSEQAYSTLAETGAEFAPDFGHARDADFKPTLSEEQAVEVAIAESMHGFDLPHGRGIEQRIDARAVTAVFSGSSDGSSRVWDILDRETWVVSLWDLPIRIPCGGTVAGGCDDLPPPHFTQAIDAHTGQIVGREIAGVGGLSSTWDGVDLRQ